MKSTTDHPIKEKINFALCFEKKKNANPTIPYNFTKVPININKVAQISFSFSIQ